MVDSRFAIVLSRKPQDYNRYSGIHLGSSVWGGGSWTTFYLLGGGGGRYQIMQGHSGSLFERFLKRRWEGECGCLRAGKKMLAIRQ